MSISSFTQLNVWKKAHQTTLEIYKLTRTFPQEERFGLVTQMRRAAVSIGANIAEGFGRAKPADKVRFYNFSQGSTEELKYYLILSRDLGYSKNGDALMTSLEEVSRMLRKLSRSILNA